MSQVAVKTRAQIVEWLKDFNGTHSEAVYFASREFGKSKSTLYRYVKEAGGWPRDDE